jgi:hypothetical protein
MTMADNLQKIPPKAVEYIKEYFREDFIFDLKGVRKFRGEDYYLVEVAKDEYIHHLTFNESGKLVDQIADEAFPSDELDGSGYKDIPE